MTGQTPNNQGYPKIWALVRGCALLMLGAGFANTSIRTFLYISGTQTSNIWSVGNSAMGIAFATLFMFAGARAVRQAGQEVAATKIGWGKLLLGTFLIYAAIRGIFAPIRGSLQPDATDTVIAALFFLGGGALIVAAFWKKRATPVKMNN